MYTAGPSILINKCILTKLIYIEKQLSVFQNLAMWQIGQMNSPRNNFYANYANRPFVLAKLRRAVPKVEKALGAHSAQ